MNAISRSSNLCTSVRAIARGFALRRLGAGRRALTAGICLAVLGATVALGASQPMRFEHIGLEEGLSQNTVLAIQQDSQGFMWFGTEDGLNRFDGRSFLHFRSQRGTSSEQDLASSYIRAISEDADGNVWIGTDGGGVARWERSQNRFTLFRSDANDAGTLATDRIQVLLVDDSGVAWVGTRDRGLDRIDPISGKVAHYRHDEADPASLSNDAVLALTIDRAGNLWVGTENGLNKMDRATGEFEQYLKDPENVNTLPGNQVRAIQEDRSGALWIGTLDGGLARFDRTSGEFEQFQHDPNDPGSLSNNVVRSVLEDDAGRIWVGTVGGLNLFNRDSSTFSRYLNDPANPHSLSNNEVMTLHQDRGGLLWVGTKFGGLNTWNPHTWSFGHQRADTTQDNALSHPVVSTFSQDPVGHLWVGTVGGGLNRFNEITQTWDHFRADSDDPRSLNSDLVMAMLHDSQGTLWAGTMNAGLARFDAASETFRTYRHDPQDPRSLSGDAIMSLFEDRDGNLWVGTFGGGISRLNRRTGLFTRFTADPDNPKALASPRVTAFAQDLSGALWIGTDGGGLHLYDSRDESFRRFQHDPKDPSTIGSNTIYALHIDAGGVLWVGTRGGGLCHLEGSPLAPEKIRFRSYSTAQGLSNADVYGIESDLQGNLWVSSNAGLTRLNPNTRSVENFYRKDGLQESEFNFGSHFRSSNGDLLFGGINGFNTFNPANLETNSTAPQIALTSIRVNHIDLDIPASTTQHIDLGYRDDIVLFEFAALDYANPDANQYAYKLEGFDADWVDLGTDRSVTYTNLKSGEYVLRVKASNADGAWNEEGLSLGIDVATSPWLTWWAYLLYGLALCSAVYGFVRHEHRKVEREEEYSQQLEGDVRQRTAQLQDRNSELKSVNVQLREASLTDSLTGLRNRRFFFEQVSKDIAMVRRRLYEVAAGQKKPEVFDMAFLMVDLDHFKSINDGCGHAAGDHVLVEVRSVLLECCRDSDIVIRWGGDEFLVLARDTDGEQASALAERIRSSIAAKVFKLGNGQIVRTTCSIGLAHFPFVRSHPDAVSWEQVVQFADSAMYEAKKERDAWVGFSSTENTLAKGGVLRLIREMPETLVEDGSLLVTRSSNSQPTTADPEDLVEAATSA